MVTIILDNAGQPECTKRYGTPLLHSQERTFAVKRLPYRLSMLTFNEVVALVGSRPKPLLVAIDGLPLSGKTTLALRLIKELGAECLGLDDLVRPEAEWPSRDKPSFPIRLCSL